MDGKTEDGNPRIPMTFRAFGDPVAPSHGQEGEGVWETAGDHGRGERMREDAKAAEDGEGEGAHYVSVISRIRRVFSICSKGAPLVCAPACVGASAAEKDDGLYREEGENREKRGKEKKEEEGEEKRAQGQKERSV